MVSVLQKIKKGKALKKGLKSMMVSNFVGKECPSCGSFQPAKAAYCTRCGAAMNERCPDCGEPCTAEDKFCRSCGIKLRRNEQ